MAQRSFKKYANLGLDEEKDFFLAGLNKKVRNARKKLEQIDELAKKDKSTLKAEQLEKIASRPSIFESIKYVDDIKELYYSSYKTAKEEGKLNQSTAEEGPKSAEQPQKESMLAQEAEPKPKQPSQTEEQRQAEIARINHEQLAKVLNLVHFVHFFKDQRHVQQLKQAVESHQVSLDSVPDVESFTEFYTKVFTFSESDKFVRIEDKLNRSLNELESYVNAVNQPALRNQSYQLLQNVVQKVADSSFFKEHKADVSIQQASVGAEPRAIGSELKKGLEQAEVPAPPAHHQEKLRSPEKETKVQETKASPVKEAKRDWGSVEDDDDEEEGLNKLREEEQEQLKFEGEGGRAVEESEKPYTTLRDKQDEEEHKQGKSVDDEWSTITAKHKEKRDEKQSKGGPGGNRPYRGGHGDGYRGDRGGPRRDGEKREKRPPREGQEQGEGQGERGGRGGFRGSGRGGSRGGGFQKREGQGDEYRKKDDVYQKRTNEGANRPTEDQ